MESIVSAGYHLYPAKMSLSVEKCTSLANAYAIRIRTDHCSMQLDLLMSPDQIDQLRVALGQGQQAERQDQFDTLAAEFGDTAVVDLGAERVRIAE